MLTSRIIDLSIHLVAIVIVRMTTSFPETLAVLQNTLGAQLGCGSDYYIFKLDN